MQIDDRIYGPTDIHQPVLIELINSKPLQRLKGINQAGASKFAIPGKTVTRYEHSVGVMILLKKLNATVEEQIAGLLHDTPHTAFSHVIDFVFNDKNHEFHERFHEKIIMHSQIPKILKNHKLDVHRILDEHNFPLLERPLPDLCADRVDYFLRDMVASDGFSEKINKYISSLIVKDNEIMLSDAATAKRFALDYLKMDKEKWSAPIEVALFQILADAIRMALDKNILEEDDIFRDDDYVYDKLKDSGDKDILQKLEMLNPNLKILDNPNDYDFHSINKLRYINPKFTEDGCVRRADEFKDFAVQIDEHKKGIKRGNYVKVVSY